MPTSMGSPHCGRGAAVGPGCCSSISSLLGPGNSPSSPSPTCWKPGTTRRPGCLGVIAILFAYTAITSYQLIGGGDILHLIFPDVITADLGKYIIAAFVIVFTAIAGMASVAYMDVVIGSLATVTLLVALPFVLHAAGGWATGHPYFAGYAFSGSGGL